MKRIFGKLTLDELTLGSLELRFETPVPVIESILGKASRIVDPAPPAPYGHRNNQIHVYDHIGLYCIEDHSSTHITAISFVLDPTQSPFPPNEPFGQPLLIGEYLLTPRSQASDVLVCCGLPFRSFLGDWSAHRDDGGLHIHLASSKVADFVAQVDVSLPRLPLEEAK